MVSLWENLVRSKAASIIYNVTVRTREASRWSPSRIAQVKVKSVTSGGQLILKGTPIVPTPRLTYMSESPIS